MANHPFAPSGSGRKATPNHRRSTRVDMVIPIIISGRDASARTFRDETRTSTVNLHGARIQTDRELLVGMHITLESPQTGIISKAICVRTNESMPGTDARYVSVQLEKPGNIWGIENPPADWAALENADQGTQIASPSQSAKGVVPGASRVPAAQMSALEEQATQIVDAAAQRLRGLVEEMLGVAFDEFQQRLDAAMAETVSQAQNLSSVNLAQLDSTFKKFQQDLEETLDLQAAQTVASTEQALRVQIPTILASILTAGSKPSALTNLDLNPKH